MKKIETNVPEPMLEQAIAMAETDGWGITEFHRMIWVMGLTAYAEGSNKRLVNEGMRIKRSDR